MRNQTIKLNRFNGIIFSIATVVLIASCAASKSNYDNQPITIQAQGSFAVGGAVITYPGSYNPYQPTPESQTLHAHSCFQ